MTVECVTVDPTNPVNLAINVFGRSTSVMVVHCVKMVLMLLPAVQIMMISVLPDMTTLNVLLIFQHIIKNVILVTVLQVTKTTRSLTASLEVTRQILTQRKS